MSDDKLFILYDGRAKYGVDTDDCIAMDTAESEKQAWKVSKVWRRVDAIWFEYDVVEKPGVTEIHNEKSRPDIGKGILL